MSGSKKEEEERLLEEFVDQTLDCHKEIIYTCHTYQQKVKCALCYNNNRFSYSIAGHFLCLQCFEDIKAEIKKEKLKSGAIKVVLLNALEELNKLRRVNQY